MGFGCNRSTEIGCKPCVMRESEWNYSTSWYARAWRRNLKQRTCEEYQTPEIPVFLDWLYALLWHLQCFSVFCHQRHLENTERHIKARVIQYALVWGITVLPMLSKISAVPFTRLRIVGQTNVTGQMCQVFMFTCSKSLTCYRFVIYHNDAGYWAPDSCCHAFPYNAQEQASW